MTRSATGPDTIVLIHGFWFDMTPFDSAQGVTISTTADGTGDFYSVALPEIERLAERIGALNDEGPSLLFPPALVSTSPLAPDERAVLQQFHTDFPAPSGPVHVSRKAGSKGTVQRPEPFRA